MSKKKWQKNKGDDDFTTYRSRSASTKPIEPRIARKSASSQPRLMIQLEDTADDSVGIWMLRYQVEQQFAFVDSFKEVEAG